MSDIIDWLATPFPDARPTWAPFAAFVMCAMVALIILAGLFPSIPERLAMIEWRASVREAWQSRAAVIRKRRASGGRHHESPAPALAEDTEAASDSDAAGTARLGA